MLSKKMLKVSPITSHTGAQPSTPLVASLVNDMQLQTRPCCSQATLQSRNFEYGRAVDTLLHDAPVFIVNWIKVGTMRCRVYIFC